MAAIAVIPARFSSTRFPGKVIVSETGKPLVQHVVERARSAKRLSDVIVAADDQRIIDALRPFDTRCVMTSPKHASGTDRVAEVARSVSDSIIVNVQGDEPEIEPQTIDALVERLESSGADMATAATPFAAGADPADPNLVKVVVALDGKALYFSRSPIPFWRDRAGPSRPAYYLHQGIYAYRREFLLQLASWPPTPLELSEKLEQLRVLEHGRSIDVILTPRAVHGIDTPQQYEEFVRRFGKNQRGVAAQATR
ncbi:MAG TPA: 3-deoxy-manno-octulosonate cytidylyltransferase [Tepidisphaeraceae bacterium]|nr:3-deoxy-manno-octulosonate cytidylyltransferase [Tepidisphaeraceae bacterium]